MTNPDSILKSRDITLLTKACIVKTLVLPVEGNGNPLQYSCLENSMDGGAWWAAVHGVAKSWTRLRDFTFTFHFHALEKEMQTHSSVLPGESQGRGSLVGCRLWGHTESDMTEVTKQQQCWFLLYSNMNLSYYIYISPPS